MRVTCPHCGTNVEVSDKNIFCPHCGEIAHPDLVVRDKLKEFASKAETKEPEIDLKAAAAKAEAERRPKKAEEDEDFVYVKRAHESHTGRNAAILVGICVVIAAAYLVYKFVLKGA